MVILPTVDMTAGDWTVWVLDSVPQIAPGFKFCAGQPRTEYAANSPQVCVDCRALLCEALHRMIYSWPHRGVQVYLKSHSSNCEGILCGRPAVLMIPPNPANATLQGTFSDDAIIVAMGVYCGTFASDETHSFLSVMYAFSKKALYTKPPAHGNTEIYAATYLSPGAWYRSVPPGGQALVEDNFKPFNNYIQPARPQTAEDVSKPPLFVMKVGHLNRSFFAW